jgi:hypothetical protein
MYTIEVTQKPMSFQLEFDDIPASIAPIILNNLQEKVVDKAKFRIQAYNAHSSRIYAKVTIVDWDTIYNMVEDAIKEAGLTRVEGCIHCGSRIHECNEGEVITCGNY